MAHELTLNASTGTAEMAYVGARPWHGLGQQLQAGAKAAADAVREFEGELGAPCFDRFDICAAYAAIESHYNVGGWLPERASNQRRRESIGCQLHRMKYRPGPLDAELPTINAMAIYRALQVRYGFDPAAD